MSGGPRVGLLERYGLVLALLVAGTVAVGIVLLRGGIDPSQVGRAYLLSVGALVILVLVMELRRLGLSRTWLPSATRPTAATLPLQLEELQDSLRVSRVNRRHYELHVVPLLREIAADRLLLLGISLSRDPAQAMAALGPQLSAALLESDPETGGLSSHRGPQQRELGALLDNLEAVGR
ncbi:MAG: hypothetical protein WA976_06680 [Candidatus Dormiibacterota bacterium]